MRVCTRELVGAGGELRFRTRVEFVYFFISNKYNADVIVFDEQNEIEWYIYRWRSNGD